jgi:hypothetical protein
LSIRVELNIYRGYGWHWKLISRNGAVLAKSNSFTRRSSCIKSLGSAMCAFGTVVEFIDTNTGKPFTL